MDFVVDPVEVEELAGGDPRRLVVENARRKVDAAVGRASRAGGAARVSGAGALAGGTGAARRRILGVDTAVVLDGRVFGKPADAGEAELFLRRLSGRTHEVMSGVVLRSGPDERSDMAVTRVRFRLLEQGDIDWYLASGEWRERAGGYAIQGMGAALVEEIEGDYWNVVGLPVPALLRLAPDLLCGG